MQGPCSSVMAYSAMWHSDVACKSWFGILKGEEPELFERKRYKPSTPLLWSLLCTMSPLLIKIWVLKGLKWAILDVYKTK